MVSYGFNLVQDFVHPQYQRLLHGPDPGARAPRCGKEAVEVEGVMPSPRAGCRQLVPESGGLRLVSLKHDPKMGKPGLWLSSPKGYEEV